jgi:membrane associated rhomboid family serine protease
VDQPPDAAVQPAESTCYRHPDRKAGVRCQRCERLICPSCMATASVGFHCPECARTGRQKVYTGAAIRAMNRPVVAQVLIAANAVVFVLGLADSARNAMAGRGGFAVDGGLFGPAVAAGEWWRIVTSGFLHAGMIHLLFNMLALYNLAMVLEPALGRARFVAVYATSLLTGSFGVLLLSPNSLTVGASGAVFGLMGALVVAQRARGIDPFASGLGGLIGINLLITFTIPGISIGGHVGGLLGGLVSGWILLELGPRSLRQPWAPLALVAALGAAAFAGSLAIA